VSTPIIRFRTNPPRTILIVCTQRIGDVLLSTPLARSLKSAWPDSHIDYLVLPGTEGILDGNMDIHNVLVFPQRVSLLQKLGQIRRVWGRYDLALAAAPTDRARLFAWAASPCSVGFTTPEELAWLKRALLAADIPFDNLNTHTVDMGLQLLGPLEIPPIAQICAPRAEAARWAERRRELALGDDPYVVVHPNPKFRYKMWDSAKWIEFIEWLHHQSFQVVLTGSNDPQEAAYVEAIVAATPQSCRSLVGCLSLAETTELVSGARLFVGPDTAVTHLAAASGTPTIALFGPSNPVKWGPWPKGRTVPGSPWKLHGSSRQGNVWLIQGEAPEGCVPCLLEGCDRHLDSDSRCLLGISVERVRTAARDLLGLPWVFITR